MRITQASDAVLAQLDAQLSRPMPCPICGCITDDAHCSPGCRLQMWIRSRGGDALLWDEIAEAAE